MKDDADGADASGWLAAQFGDDADSSAQRPRTAEDTGHVSRRAARAARHHAQSAGGETDVSGAPPDTVTPTEPAPESPPPPTLPGPQHPASPALPYSPPAPSAGGFRWNLGAPAAAPPPAAPPPEHRPDSVPASAAAAFETPVERVPEGPDGAEPEPLGPEGFQPAPPGAGRRVVDPFLPDDPSLPEPVLPHPGRALPTELFSPAVPGEPTVPLVSRRTFLPAETHIPVWPDATPELPTELLPAGVADRDPDDSPLAALFREHEHRTTGYRAPTEAYDIAHSPDSEVQASDRRAGTGRSNQRILLWGAGVLLAIVALVALFFAGTALPQLFGAGSASPAVPSSPSPSATVSPSASPSISPSASPSPQLMAAAAGPRPPGDYAWDELAGGECLAGYTSPWAEDFTVVDCATKHPAQLLQRGVFGPDDSSAYPGVKALQAKSVTLCSASSLLDLGAAGAYRDLQVAASYAATKEEWAAGHRDYFCFVSRASGEDLTGSVASAR